MRCLISDRKKAFMRCFAAAVAIAMVSAGAAWAAEVAVIRVGYRDVQEMLPLVETLLSPGAKVSADERTNSLVIVADKESIARVRAFLADMDKPVRQALVRVRFEEARSEDERSLAASGRISGKDWSVGTAGDRRDGVRVRVQDRSLRNEGSTEAMLRIMSGSRGYIRVGEEIPYTERWVVLARRYARVMEIVGFQRIDTGFEVRPVIQDGQADIEIVPRISQPGVDGSAGVIRFAEAATRIRVPLGQWTSIGGTGQQFNEAVRAILSSGSREGERAVSMSLLVTE